jgi:hypothetical protein
MEADIPQDSQPPINAKQGLLFEWWSVFWTLFTAKNNGSGPEEALLYTQVCLLRAGSLVCIDDLAASSKSTATAAAAESYPTTATANKQINQWHPKTAWFYAPEWPVAKRSWTRRNAQWRSRSYGFSDV